MRLKSIAAHLRPYLMLARRRTTMNHAFAAAIAPSDTYDEGRSREALLVLGLNPEGELECAYCGEPAETWDHVFATVRNSRFSGYGHRLGNLMPCCKPCNSRKGNKHWQAHLEALQFSPVRYEQRRDAIERFLATYATIDPPLEQSADQNRLDEIHKHVLELLEEGDRVAARIRSGRT